MKTFSAFSICYGSLLGDAYLNSKRIISFRQSLNKKQYIDWLYSQLVCYTTENGVKYWKQFDKRTQKIYESCGFSTKAVFKELYPVFYPHGKKQLPSGFEEMINPLGLALWYMDDGGRTSPLENAVFLTVDSYSVSEIHEIQRVFVKKFNIQTTFQKAGKTSQGNPQYRLRIGVEAYPRFYNLVYDVISQIPDMRHRKLPFPNEKSIENEEVRREY